MIKQDKTSEATMKPLFKPYISFVFAVVFAGSAVVVWAQENVHATDLRLLESSIQKAIEIAKPATVAIQEAAPNRPGFFSGVIVSDEGHILSVGHAVRVGLSTRSICRMGDPFAPKVWAEKHL